MTKADDKKTGAVRGKVVAAFRAVGRALGLVERRGCEARETRKPGLAHRRLSARQIVLETEIHRLETELDRVYARVVEGVGQAKRNQLDPATPELAEVIDLSRELRERLRAKRAELTRLERDAARELKLLRVMPAATELPSTRENFPTAPNPPEEPPDSEQSVLEERVRNSILRASRISSFDDKSKQVIFEKLVGDLLASDPEVRRNAAARLGELKTSAVFGVLRAALFDPENKVRAAALNSLALLGDDSPPELFRRYTNSTQHHLRLAALRGLARAKDPKDDPTLLAALEDAHPAVRKAAATYLGWRETRGVTRALISALHDEEKEVRAAAASSLGNLRKDRAVLSLIRILLDPDADVRTAAKTAIESTLGEKIDVDIEAESEARRRRIEELKEWWKGARIDKQLARKEGLDLHKEPKEAEPPVRKPAARGVDPAGRVQAAEETEAAREPAKVVDLKSVAASRTRPGTASGKEDAEEAAEEPAANEAAAEPEESEMPAELEGLGTIKASGETKAEKDEMPEGLDGLGIRVADGKAEEGEEKNASDEDADEDKQEGNG
jgi:hypothetical protein